MTTDNNTTDNKPAVESKPVENKGYSIAEAARIIGVSTRQVRRYIVAGKLPADKLPGKFGDEYHITTIPADLIKEKPQTEEQPDSTADASVAMTMELVKRLEEENRNLAGRLGMAQERIRALEEQVNLLSAPKPAPWYKRIFKFVR